MNVNHNWRFTFEKIGARLALIEPLIHRRSMPLPPFRMTPLEGAVVEAPVRADASGWTEIPAESYWGAPALNFLMKTAFAVPEGWSAGHLALYLPLGVYGDIFNHPEALVHIDGRAIGSADRYHHTIPLDPACADGAEHAIALHGWTGLAGWPPDPNSKAKLFMGVPALIQRDPEALAFWQLASTVHDTVSVLERDQPERDRLLDALEMAFRLLDTRDPIGEEIYGSFPAARQALLDGIARAGAPLDVVLHGIGHAHMDIAYLWQIDQIRLKNARTYSNVLRLMDEDPDYTFSHSQPALYVMCAEDYPEIFDRIGARVAEGRWEVMGGMWVEPDLNVPGAEALVRQLVLGRRYFRETFGGVETPVLWLPDTFGFPGQIPQLMRLAGLEWFATNKLNWNQMNPVPWSTHLWEGIDGSRVLAHIFTTPRPVQYLPFPTNYKSDLSAREVLGSWTRSTTDGVRDLPVCYGYGDGGGGPTETLLAKAHIFEDMPGMPRFKMSTVRRFFERIEPRRNALPVWRGEHYMEGHRGVFTSQGWIKRANRKAERALHEAEALSAMAGLAPDLEAAWRLLCLNQFHDIITGTSITEVFADARRDLDRVAGMAEAAAAEAAARLGGGELCVLNTSPVAGRRLVEGPAEGAVQTTEAGGLYLFEVLPAYSATPLTEAVVPSEGVTVYEGETGIVLENGCLLAVVGANGQILRLYDKEAGREVLAQGLHGNVLQAFEDRPICWDAWDIDPHFEDRRELIDAPATVEIVETGPLRATLRVDHVWRGSRITQEIRLEAGSRRLDFVTEVDWHQSHILLKVAFPVSVKAREARFDIQWGSVLRSTSRDTAFDAARFEVPAQKWAELAEPGYAVALLNDCKYGYDVRENVLRLSLIKSATSPDPQADQGRHVFTYALLANPGGEARRLQEAAYDLNTPPRVAEGSAGRFVSCESETIILETLKPSEDGAAVVLRLFESGGAEPRCTLRFRDGIRRAARVDIFEAELEDLDSEARDLRLELGPFEIATVKVWLER
ncbi:alpha-mannosidase [Aestuariibius insulae]|uniref:alpha-mannosidase n=1 Tax=Aestuariibius insulae TaxID=2058287 RepID=UPI00345ECB0F